MAETIVAAGMMPSAGAEMARMLALLQSKDASAVAAQAINEAELAALAQLLVAKDAPVVVRTEQLQRFLATVLPELARDVVVTTQAALTEELIAQLPVPQQATAQAPVQQPVQTPVQQTVVSQNPVLAQPQPQQQPAALPQAPLPGATPTPTNVAANAFIQPDVAPQPNATPAMPTQTPALPAGQPMTQATPQELVLSPQMANLRSAYNATVTNEVQSPRLSQLMAAQTETVFATAISGKAMPVNITVVDAQRVIGDHSGANAKAFLLGELGKEFSVVMLNQQFGTGAPVTTQNAREVASQLQTALNTSLAQAFPNQSTPPEVKVIPLQNGTFAIAYPQTQSGHQLHAAPLLENAGFSLFAQPVKGGDQLIQRLDLNQLGVGGNIRVVEDRGGNKTTGEGGGVPGMANAEAASWAHNLTGWFNALVPGAGTGSSKPSLVAIGIALVAGILIALDAPHWKDYAWGVGLLSGVAAAFSMWSARREQDVVRYAPTWHSPWRYVKPLVNYVKAAVRGSGEPWEYFAHERDWLEWSEAARLTGAAHAEMAKLFLPAERDAFTTLGLRANATWEDINSAFRVLAKRYHPDRNPEANVEQRQALTHEFQRILSAYSVLRRRFHAHS